jgi:hypothetical protein
MKDLVQTIHGIKKRANSPKKLEEEEMSLKVPGFKEARASVLNVSDGAESPNNKINKFANNFNW